MKQGQGRAMAPNQAGFHRLAPGLTTEGIAGLKGRELGIQLAQALGPERGHSRRHGRPWRGNRWASHGLGPGLLAWVLPGCRLGHNQFHLDPVQGRHRSPVGGSHQLAPRPAQQPERQQNKGNGTAREGLGHGKD